MRRFLIPSVIAVTGMMVFGTWWRGTPPPATGTSTAKAVAVMPSTTRHDLENTIAALERQLAERPRDGEAAVRLAQMLVRVQRVESDASAAVKAEHVLRRFLEQQPEHYEAQRELGTALLSQHRFRDALSEARRAQRLDPRDAFNYGVIGDASLELGEYDAAFAAFDEMGRLRPGPPAYARVAYALELKGDLEAAVEQMRMAADSTSAHDAEAQAWHYAQVGNLLLQLGHTGEARREFERADATFPKHPYAQMGLARTAIADGRYPQAMRTLREMYEDAATPELAFVIGDLHHRLGDARRAEEMYVAGERLERDGWVTEEPQPQALARFLAERGRDIPGAVILAEEAAAKRQDIHTLDALAWAYFKADRLDEAMRASEAALRTGTRDARVVFHAAAIRDKRGDASAAQVLLKRAAVPLPDLTLLPMN